MLTINAVVASDVGVVSENTWRLVVTCPRATRPRAPAMGVCTHFEA